MLVCRSVCQFICAVLTQHFLNIGLCENGKRGQQTVKAARQVLTSGCVETTCFVHLNASVPKQCVELFMTEIV